MVAVETSDPNKTVAAKTFFSNWPSFMTGNSRPSCESKTLSVSNAYYTSNAAFSYKLDSIQATVDGKQQYYGDIPYYNNALRDCFVPNNEISFQGLDRSALQIARQQWGAELKSEINCTVDIPEGSRTIKLTTTYDLNSADFNSALYRFPGRDQVSKSSLFWGESLLAWYYIKLTSDIYNATLSEQNAHPERKSYKGYVQYFPPNSTIKHPEDYKNSSSFFRTDIPGCFFVSFSDNGIEQVVHHCISETKFVPFVNHTIWDTAETITKVLVSTLLADLGQTSPNILTDQELLALFSKNIDTISTQQKGGSKMWGWGNNLKISETTLALTPYTAANATKYKLGIDISSISVTYLRQVPKMKSTGSLVFSVLIADFVLLQVLWKVFILIVDFVMYRQYPNMGACQGCEKGSEDEEELQLLHTKVSGGGSPRMPKPGSVYSRI